MLQPHASKLDFCTWNEGTLLKLVIAFTEADAPVLECCPVLGRFACCSITTNDSQDTSKTSSVPTSPVALLLLMLQGCSGLRGCRS